jgi:hypothetical protein
MILEIVAALALAVLSAAGIAFLVAHALSDYKSKSEVTQRILEQYMVNNKLKLPEPVKPLTPPNPNQPR